MERSTKTARLTDDTHELLEHKRIHFKIKTQDEMIALALKDYGRTQIPLEGRTK